LFDYLLNLSAALSSATNAAGYCTDARTTLR
jgi:hypothetical protein